MDVLLWTESNRWKQEEPQDCNIEDGPMEEVDMKPQVNGVLIKSPSPASALLENISTLKTCAQSREGQIHNVYLTFSTFCVSST